MLIDSVLRVMRGGFQAHADSSITGALDLIGLLYLDPQVLSGDGGALGNVTPTRSLIVANHDTGAATITLQAPAETDDVAFLLVHNKSAQNLIITDTGATPTGGNETLGTDDAAAFIYSNSKWVALFVTNNS